VPCDALYDATVSVLGWSDLSFYRDDPCGKYLILYDCLSRC
jgi:hypothetical protein